MKLGQKVEEKSTYKMELQRAELNKVNESDMGALCPDVALIGRYRNGKSRDVDPGSPTTERRHLCLKKEIMKHAGINGIYQLHTRWVRVDDKSLKTDVRQPGNDMVTGKMRHAQLDREQCWESSLAPGSPSSLTYLQRIQDCTSASQEEGLEIRPARASLNRVARPVYLEMDDLSDAASLISDQSVDVLMPESIESLDEGFKEYIALCNEPDESPENHLEKQQMHEALQKAMSEFINPENADTFGDFVHRVKELKVYHDDHISDFSTHGLSEPAIWLANNLNRGSDFNIPLRQLAEFALGCEGHDGLYEKLETLSGQLKPHALKVAFSRLCYLAEDSERAFDLCSIKPVISVQVIGDTKGDFIHFKVAIYKTPNLSVDAMTNDILEHFVKSRDERLI